MAVLLSVKMAAAIRTVQRRREKDDDETKLVEHTQTQFAVAQGRLNYLITQGILKKFFTRKKKTYFCLVNHLKARFCTTDIALNSTSNLFLLKKRVKNLCCLSKHLPT